MDGGGGTNTIGPVACPRQRSRGAKRVQAVDVPAVPPHGAVTPQNPRVLRVGSMVVGPSIWTMCLPFLSKKMKFTRPLRSYLEVAKLDMWGSQSGVSGDHYWRTSVAGTQHRVIYGAANDEHRGAENHKMCALRGRKIQI